MFVRVKKIGAYEYLYLVENAREGGRHVQRVIKALGRRDEVEASGLLDGLIASAARHSRRSIVLSSFYRGELAELRRRSIGPDLVFGRLWAETGCRDVLRSLLADRRFGFDVERAVYLTVLHRLMVSGSDRHASSWRQRLRIPGAEGSTLEHAYKAMAWLGEDDRSRAAASPRPSRRRSTAIASRCSASSRSPSSTPRRCSSRAQAARRWASAAIPRTTAAQLNQVVLGIVLDERGPADRLVPDARQHRRRDRAAAGGRAPARALRHRRACIVADRGMISADTIAALEAQKIDYILGVRERSSREVRADGASTMTASAVPLAIPRQKGETELAVKEVTVAGRRYILCRNEEEASKDAEARAELHRRSRTQAGAGRQGAGRQQGLPPLPRRRPQATASPSIAPRSRPMRASTACSCCAPTPSCPRCRWCCATATCWPWRMPSRPPRRCWPRGRSSTRPMPAIRGHVFCTFLALVLRKELIDRLAARHGKTVGMAAHRRRSRRSQRDRGRAGRPPRPAAHRTRPDHRSDLPRPRPHPAAGLPGAAAAPADPA